MNHDDERDYAEEAANRQAILDEQRAEAGIREVEVKIAAGNHVEHVAIEVGEDEIEAYKAEHGRPASWGGMDPWERDPHYDVAAKVAVEKVRALVLAKPDDFHARNRARLNQLRGNE